MVKKITKEQAVAENAKRYFTGNACKKGHVVERYTKNSTCVKCAYEATTKWRSTGENRERYNEYQLDYNSRLRKTRKTATPFWTSTEAIEHIHRECKRLSQSMRMNFEVTYIIPLKHKTVCGLHTAENMEVSSISHRNLKGRRFNSSKESKELLKRLKDVGF